LTLVPVDETPPPREPADGSAETSANSPSLHVERTQPADWFLAEANREYNEGRIDQPLWDRALVQSGGDMDAATMSYLRARATALRVLQRDPNLERRNRSPGEGDRSRSPSGRKAETRASGASRLLAWKERLNPRYLAVGVVIAGALGLAWMVFGDRDGDPTPRQAVATASPASAPPTQAPSAAGAQPGNPGTAAAKPEDRGQELARKVQELRDAGNWNVLVLYAAEWTRKEPQNATAWNQLSIGYANLRQFSDAQEAAKKAVELAPKNVLYWRSLGQASLDLGDPEAALQAFEQAISLDDQDIQSLVNIGNLNLRFERLPAAKVAFDKALAINPTNADALCGDVSIAQRSGARKEAEATLRQLKTLDIKCRESGEPTDVAPAPTPPSTYKALPVRVR
jgi:tetratricopeptide (TPR) repeat protein